MSALFLTSTVLIPLSRKIRSACLENKEAVFQAEKGRTIAEKRYEVGKGTILELNSSEVALTEAQLTYNQSIYDYLVAKADLDLVLGIDEVTER